jgi:hypothetical protein
VASFFSVAARAWCLSTEPVLGIVNPRWHGTHMRPLRSVLVLAFSLSPCLSRLFRHFSSHEAAYLASICICDTRPQFSFGKLWICRSVQDVDIYAWISLTQWVFCSKLILYHY